MSPAPATPAAFSIEIGAKAPPFLDKQGRQIEPDPLAQAFAQVREAFSRLHGQRLVEVMKAVFEAMPAGEKIWLEWVHDESSMFYLRFGNGWSLDEHTESMASDSANWIYRTKAKSPQWLRKGPAKLAQWKRWHNLLHCYTIDPGVDGDALERLHGLSESLDGLSAKDLPLIESTLVGPVFGAGLASVRLDGALAPPGKSRSRRNRM